MGEAIIARRGGGALWKFLDYSGDHVIYGTPKKGYMLLTSSGTLTSGSDMNVDVFLVGGGGSGSGHNGQPNGYPGGGGGYTKTFKNISITKSSETSVTIGAGGINSAGGYSQFGDSAVNMANGGKRSPPDGGSGGGGTNGGEGGTDGSDGQASTSTWGAGQGTTTRAFEADVAPFSAMLFSGGGGGGGNSSGTAPAGSGGAGGGADGGAANQSGAQAGANTGGGGGGAGGSSSIARTGGNGGSGICLIRWGDWSAGMES